MTVSSLRGVVNWFSAELESSSILFVWKIIPAAE